MVKGAMIDVWGRWEGKSLLFLFLYYRAGGKGGGGLER